MKRSKTVNKARKGPHSVLVLSERSLVSMFGTPYGMVVPGYTAGMDTVALVGTWVMGGNG